MIVTKGVKMKFRTLKSGRKVKDIGKEFDMTITSQCPDKWLFVDLETGDIWHIRNDAKDQKKTYNNPFWRGATKVEMKDLALVAKAELKYVEDIDKGKAVLYPKYPEVKE